MVLWSRRILVIGRECSDVKHAGVQSRGITEPDETLNSLEALVEVLLMRHTHRRLHLGIRDVSRWQKLLWHIVERALQSSGERTCMQ